MPGGLRAAVLLGGLPGWGAVEFGLDRLPVLIRPALPILLLNRYIGISN